MKTRYIPIGSYSTGTLREEDVIPELLSILDEYGTREEKGQIKRIYSEELSWLKMDEDDRDNYEEELQLDELRARLEDILSSHCAPYTYFGSHPGDGADIGCWVSESLEEDFDGLKVSDLAEVPTGYTGEVLLINDHGNVTLYACTRGRLREVWSVV